MTRAQIQALIDALPSVGALPDGASPVGGFVDVPAGTHTLDGPLDLDCAVSIRGQGYGTVLKRDHATDPIAYYHTAGGHGYLTKARLENLCIYNPQGPGVMFDSSVIGEWASVEMENVIFNTVKTAVSLRATSGAYGNSCYLKNVQVHTCTDGIPFDIRSRLMNLENCWVINAIRTGLHLTEPAFNLEGDGIINNCWSENSRGAPLYRFATTETGGGTFTYLAGHNEPRLTTADGVPYMIVLDNVNMMADEFFFVSLLNPVHMLNNSILTLLRRMNHGDGLGGTAPMNQCYLSDGTANRIVFNGYVYEGTPFQQVSSSSGGSGSALALGIY